MDMESIWLPVGLMAGCGIKKTSVRSSENQGPEMNSPLLEAS